MEGAIIDIQNVSKSYNEGILVLHDVSLRIDKGDFVTIIGPSGCGKTTLLRLINNMTGYGSGEILVMGRALNEWDKIELRRSIGYVIQQGGLFPHLSIWQNIAFGLSIADHPRQIITERVEEMAALMNFDERQLDAFPSELSGGQQQRVGVARALAVKPEIVLMDEPFGALDNITRRNLQKELLSMHHQLGITFVMVTHDINEAFTLGTKVAIMNNGRIEQYGQPAYVKSNPVNNWVVEFLE